MAKFQFHLPQTIFQGYLKKSFFKNFFSSLINFFQLFLDKVDRVHKPSSISDLCFSLLSYSGVLNWYCSILEYRVFLSNLATRKKNEKLPCRVKNNEMYPLTWNFLQKIISLIFNKCNSTPKKICIFFKSLWKFVSEGIKLKYGG